MFKSILLSLVLVPSAFAQVLFSTATNQEVSMDELTATLSHNSVVVLGEFHSMPKIQKAQGDIIRKVVTDLEMQSRFTVGWEFLNYTDQVNIENLFGVYKIDKINEQTLLEGLYPNANDLNYYAPYLEFFKAAKELDGQLIGVNVPRSIKRVITKKGFSHMDPEHVPENMERGSDNYFDRFMEAMGGHGPSDIIERYFMAQSYTDSVMAWYLQQDAAHDLKFIIAGSFHTDYNDGVVDQIKKDTTSQVVNIKILKSEMFSEEEIEMMKTGHPKYGMIADYLYIID